MEIGNFYSFPKHPINYSFSPKSQNENSRQSQVLTVKSDGGNRGVAGLSCLADRRPPSYDHDRVLVHAYDITSF